MTVEDFTSYTEVDADSDITIAAGSVTIATMRTDVDSYVYKDYGVGYFGNFTHKVDTEWTGESGASYGGQSGIWALGNITGSILALNGAGSGLVLSWYQVASNDFRMYMNDQPSTNTYYKWTSRPAKKYLTVSRSGTTLTCLIFTDSGRTTLETTMAITCAATTFRYIYCAQSRHDHTVPYNVSTLSAVNSNLDLQIVSGTGGTVTAPIGDGIKARSSSVAAPTQAARKPYLSLKQSMSAFFSEHVRFIKDQARGPESAFEKPYMDWEYPTMHLNIPTPDWGASGTRWWYNPGEWTPGRDPHGGAVPVKRCPGCALYADPPIDCDHPVEIHSGIWCTNTPGAATDSLTTSKTAVFNSKGEVNKQLIQFAGQPAIADAKVSGVQAGDTKLEIYATKGQIRDITVGAWAFIGPSAAVIVDSTVASHTICGRMVDGAKSVCIACVDVTCACNCASTTAMTVDPANSDTTIAPGGTANISVLNGCGPFTWSISGWGHVLDAAITQARSNKVTSSGGTCGTGATQHAATATVTITDSCGTVATHTLKNTQGQWTQTARYFTGDGAPCYPAASTTWHCREIYYSATKRAVANSANLFGGWIACADTGSTCPWNYWDGTADSMPPGCANATACADYSDPECVGAKSSNAYKRLSIQYWTCSGTVGSGC